MTTLYECFNEAEAFTPRIAGETNTTTRDVLRFNEAEAFTPRIGRFWTPEDESVDYPLQ